MIPAWVAPYIGLPFKEHGRTREGCDCWGLLTLIYREQFGLAVPSYEEGYATTRDGEAIASLVALEASSRWIDVPSTAVQVPDALVFRIKGLPMHVGIVVAPGRFLHVLKGTNACIESYTGPKWNHRILAAYRHMDLVSHVVA